MIAYARLTKHMADVYGSQPTFCVAAHSVGLDTSNLAMTIDEFLAAVKGDAESATHKIRAIQVALLSILAYVKQIKAHRMYKFVIRRIILLVVLLELVEFTVKYLVGMLDALAAIVVALEELRKWLECENTQT